VADGSNPCVAGQPCFTNVTDILNGRRHLLRDDHLILGVQYFSDGGLPPPQETIDLRTSNSSLVSSGFLGAYDS